VRLRFQLWGETSKLNGLVLQYCKLFPLPNFMFHVSSAAFAHARLRRPARLRARFAHVFLGLLTLFMGNFKSNPRFFKNNPKKKIALAIGLATAPPYIF
jgi:hypothetical protein